MKSGRKPQFPLELQNWETFRLKDQYLTTVTFQLCWAYAQLKHCMASSTLGRISATFMCATIRKIS
eukprot:4784442-Prorocentrum_lima.AAC.1